MKPELHFNWKAIALGRGNLSGDYKKVLRLTKYDDAFLLLSN
jgi:hypothetical protein